MELYDLVHSMIKDDGSVWTSRTGPYNHEMAKRFAETEHYHTVIAPHNPTLCAALTEGDPHRPYRVIESDKVYEFATEEERQWHLHVSFAKARILHNIGPSHDYTHVKKEDALRVQTQLQEYAKTAKVKWKPEWCDVFEENVA